MKANKRGSLIVIEGVDGSGKETQTKKLYDRLKGKGVPIKKISYPRYDKESSTLIKMYLRGDFGDKADDVSPYIASTFYALDRYASYKEDYEGFYKEGGLVLADRYTTSNMFHQGGKITDPREREKFLDWLWDYEFNLYGLPVPDLVFFLDIPLDINTKLRKGRLNKFSGDSKQDIHEEDAEDLNTSYESALALVNKYGRETISCIKDGSLKTRDEIHEEIFNRLIEFIDNKR